MDFIKGKDLTRVFYGNQIGILEMFKESGKFLKNYSATYELFKDIIDYESIKDQSEIFLFTGKRTLPNEDKIRSSLINKFRRNYLFNISLNSKDGKIYSRMKDLRAEIVENEKSMAQMPAWKYFVPFLKKSKDKNLTAILENYKKIYENYTKIENYLQNTNIKRIFVPEVHEVYLDLNLSSTKGEFALTDMEKVNEKLLWEYHEFINSHTFKKSLI